MGFPNMRKTVWTLLTQPPDLAIAARPDENVAQVLVEPVMPLFLQLISKQAGIRTVVKLLALLLRHTVSATANVTGMPCRSAKSIQRQTYLANQTAQAGLPRQKTKRTDNGMRTSVQSSSRSLRLLCVAHQPPDAVRHLRGPPESRPCQV